MQTTIPTLGTISRGRRLMPATAALGLLSVFAFAQAGLAQTDPPLNFGNNYFVTGDYVVGSVGLRGMGDATGFATGTINIPDNNSGSVPATGVPPGAQFPAAILYWQTVESSATAFAGQQGFFRPVFAGGPATGYPITGVLLGNPNAPTSWSSGGCSGNSQGSKTIRTYRADVRPFLPQDSKGNVLVNGKIPFEVRLADSGSNGGGAPLTLGATLVLIYRVLSPNFPLSSVVIYDGAFAPSNASSKMTQTMQGFYQAAEKGLIAKLTHIVGNGKTNKLESVYLNSVNLPSLYGSLPPFPGNYNGSWDAPTWIVNKYGLAVNPGDSSETTSVVPSSSNSGCVSWAAIILKTTVQNKDNDSILDVWKTNKGYCDASINEGACKTTDPGWVPLPGATLGQKDLFVQMDYMCSIVNADGTCDTTNGTSELPTSQALTMVTNAFSPKGINLHLIPTNAIQEQACTDNLLASPPQLCPFPNQPGVVGWKAGFEFLKTQPLNINPATGNTYTEAECEQNPTTCVRRFQHGKKDSYHYALFGHALGAPTWNFLSGTLTSVVASGTTVTFTTSSPHGLIVDAVAGNGRVTVADAITNLNLDGIFFVQSVPSLTTFTIQIATAANATYTSSTDPRLSVSSGLAGTGSGVSDVGGADSLITLGLWGPDGLTVPSKAGTTMHELGHSLGLTHGGFYYDTAGSYVPTIEPNCKPNFQSVMSYLFQVDLLDNGVLDYSEQGLSTLNESSLPAGVTTTDGSALAFSTTKWYTPTQPGGVGTKATHHCDGTPLSPLTDINPTMYREEGTADPITPAWVTPTSDINFDGIINPLPALRGYNDWANIDLRQIGATGSDILGGGGSFSGSPGSFSGSPGSFSGSPGSFSGSPGSFSGSPGSFSGAPGTAGGREITLETANSVTRPPRHLTATALSSPSRIQLDWTVPTFGQIGAFNIYRGVGGAAPTPPAFATVSGAPPPTTFTDKDISCGNTYTYFVTAVLAETSQESVPSNSVIVVKCVVVQ